MEKKTLAFLFNTYVDIRDTDTAVMPAVIMCNALAKHFDVKLVLDQKLVYKFKDYISNEVKLVSFDNRKFFKTEYILDIKKVDDFCKDVFNVDYVVAFGMVMSAPGMLKQCIQPLKTNRPLHLRMVQMLKSSFTLIMIAKSFQYAKEKAILRVFDYWNIVNFHALIDREIKYLGLYEDKAFYNPQLKVGAKIAYCPDIDYLKFVKDIVKMPSKKTRLFTFGYNIGSYRPQSMSDFLADNLKDDPSSKIFVYRKYERNGVKYNNLIPMKKYYAAIAQSKYTLIIPSTLASEVSVLRVNESIRRQCIPLFTADNNIDKVYSKRDAEFIRSKLMYDKSKWKNINEWLKTLDSQYEALLKEVEDLDFVKAGYALTEDDIVKAIENV